jgi:hypothetical protein
MRAIIGTDDLSRFALSSSAFVSRTGRVRASLFLPASDGHTSVYVTTDLDDAGVWRIGRELVAAPQSKPLYGRADVSVRHVESAGLAVAADEPPERHASITGWPAEKDSRKSVAQLIAEHARFIPYPASPKA